MYSLEQLRSDLQNDIAHEVMHMNCYLLYASTIRSFHREELREFYLKEAASEMKHVTEFTDRLIGLGGNPVWPTTHPVPFDTEAKTPIGQLTQILAMEMERVEMYARRIKQCEELGGPDGMSMHVFYEDQINDSRLTVDHVRQMLLS